MGLSSASRKRATINVVARFSIISFSPTPPLTLSKPSSHMRPSPLQRDVGGSLSINGGFGDGKILGVDPASGRPTQCVTKTGNDFLSLPVFSHSFFLNPLLTSVTPTPSVPPLPSRPNVSRGGFLFLGFDTSMMTATSLMSKCESEVVFVSVSAHPPPPPPLRTSASWRWTFSTFRHVCRHHLLPRIQIRAGGGFF